MLPINFNQSLLDNLIRKFYKSSLDFKLEPGTLNWHDQEVLLNATIQSALVKSYPVKNDYAVQYLKKILGFIEQSQDVHDDLYENLCMLMKNNMESDYYRHYVIGNDIENIVTLKETNRMVVNGTTGMRTWEAALMLADWILCHKNLLKNKKVLELGSGVGFTGITIAKYSESKCVMLSDCHEDVLNALEHNIQINFPELNSVTCPFAKWFTEGDKQIGIMHLDWNNVFHFDENEWPDIVIGADIVYDPSILEPLCNVLKYFLTRNKLVEAYIAGVIRNQETFEMFLSLLDDKDMSFEKINHESPVFLEWNSDLKLYLLRIKIKC